jgi:hypothetical protein
MALLVHGLAVDPGPFRMHALHTDRAPDVVISVVDPASVSAWPDDDGAFAIGSTGSRVAEHYEAGQTRPRLVVSERDGRLHITWPGLTSAQWEPTTNRLLFPSRAAETGEIQQLLLPAALGAIAMLRGRLVLHATAVALDQGAVFLVAPKGGGKSSVAVLACDGGARLVAEDVCAYEIDAGLHAGSFEVRLRKTTPWISQAPTLTHVVDSIDDRVTVVPPTVTEPCVPVAAVVLLTLSHEAVADHTHVSGAAALGAVLAAQRCAPVGDHPLAGTMFDAAAHLVNEVPVIRVAMPWRAEDRRSSRAFPALRSVIDLALRG